MDRDFLLLYHLFVLLNTRTQNTQTQTGTSRQDRRFNAEKSRTSVRRFLSNTDTIRVELDLDHLQCGAETRAIPLGQGFVRSMGSSKIHTQNSKYVNEILSKLRDLWLRLEAMRTAGSILPSEADSIWAYAFGHVVEEIVEGFAKTSRKCSMEGRGLMAMDVAAVEHGVRDIHPLPRSFPVHCSTKNTPRLRSGVLRSGDAFLQWSNPCSYLHCDADEDVGSMLCCCSIHEIEEADSSVCGESWAVVRLIDGEDAGIIGVMHLKEDKNKTLRRTKITHPIDLRFFFRHMMIDEKMHWIFIVFVQRYQETWKVLTEIQHFQSHTKAARAQRVPGNEETLKGTSSKSQN